MVRGLDVPLGLPYLRPRMARMVPLPPSFLDRSLVEPPKPPRRAAGDAPFAAVAGDAPFAAVLASLREAVITIDEPGRIVFFNAAAEKMFGVDAASVLGQSLDRLIPVRHRVPHHRHVGRMLAMESTSRRTGAFARVTGLRRNGEEFPLEGSVSLVRLEEQTFLTAVLRDAAEFQEADAERERDLSRKIIDTARAVILLLDREGRVVDFNRHMENLSGWSIDDVRGSGWFDLFIPEDERESVRALFEQAGEGTKAQGNVNGILTRSGETRRIRWYDARLHGGDGRLNGLLAIGHDVTDEENLEDRLRRALESTARIEERERQKLASDLHDSVSQTLALAAMKIDALSARVEGGEDGLALVRIRQLVCEADETVRNLSFQLSLSVDSGLSPVPAIEALVARLRDRFGMAVTIEDKGSRIRIEKRAKTALLRGLRELLINVLRHAGVEEARIRLRAVGGDLEVMVEDDGRGFDPAEAEGFGLESVRERLLQVGGRLEVVSAPGTGTRARLLVPGADLPVEDSSDL